MTSAEKLAQGWQHHKAGRLADAERIYREVHNGNPNDPDALCYLGILNYDLDRLFEAEKVYRRSLQIRPGHPIVLNNLGNTLRKGGRTAEALACYDEALRLKPDYVNAHRNRGTAFYWDGKLEPALACFRRGLELAPNDAQLHTCLGVALLLSGDWSAGWSEYEWRLKGEAPLPPYPQPMWDGGSLDGKTILLHGEQGFGDTIQFIRYAANLKARWKCCVIALLRRPIIKLLAEAPAVDEFVPHDLPLPHFDVYTPLLNVPQRLGETPASIERVPPHVTPSAALSEKWRAELARYSGVKIGLAWQGSKAHQADQLRSFPLTALLPLSRLAGITWFSLQKGVGTEQLENVFGRMPIVPLGDRIDLGDDAFLESAAVLKNLDLLITADTALLHVAGAMQAPAWALLSHVPDWRWLRTGSSTPWYPSVRLFRQPQPHDWSSVVAEVAAALPIAYPSLRPKPPEDFRIAGTGMNRLVAAKHGLMLCNKNDVYIGRSMETYGEFSEEENEVFRQVLRPGQTVVEAGANIGSHTLGLSTIVGERGLVIAFEPQRIVFQTLCANVALDSRLNVDCRCAALGETAGTLLVPRIDYRGVNNFGGVSLDESRAGEAVPQIALDSLQLTQCDLLKADVEGMELAVLRGAKETIARCRPLLYLESDRKERRAALFGYVRELGYRAYWHRPQLYSPSNYFQNATNVFGNTGSFNWLCVHTAFRTNFQGLTLVEESNL